MWYSKGELGEYVLDIVEAAIDETIDQDQFISKLRQIGLSDQEIMTVYAEEVLGV